MLNVYLENIEIVLNKIIYFILYLMYKNIRISLARIIIYRVYSTTNINLKSSFNVKGKK